MTTTPVKLSFTEYLNYHDDTDNRYELVNGELVAMNPASPEHIAIIRFIFLQFYQEILRLKLDLEVFSSDLGVRTASGRSRLPDVCVVRGEDWRHLRSRQGSSAVLETNPLIAVEVVSPGEEGYNRDYVEKPQEYAEIKIPEYWIIDPIATKISVLNLVENNYQTQIYRGQDCVVSLILSELNLTVEQILSA
jgi:Uma2 family endonuclease